MLFFAIARSKTRPCSYEGVEWNLLNNTLIRFNKLIKQHCCSSITFICLIHFLCLSFFVFLSISLPICLFGNSFISRSSHKSTVLTLTCEEWCVSVLEQLPHTCRSKDAKSFRYLIKYKCFSPRNKTLHLI